MPGTPLRLTPSKFVPSSPCPPAQKEGAHKAGGVTSDSPAGLARPPVTQPTRQTSARTKTWKSLAHKYVPLLGLQPG